MNFMFVVALFTEYIGIIAVTMIMGLSPRFKRRPLVFQFPRREGLVSLGLLVLAGAAQWALLPRAAEALGLPAASTGDFTFTIMNLGTRVLIWGLLLLPFGASLLIRRQPLLSVGLGRQTWNASLQLGVALALMAVFLRGKVYPIINGAVQAPQLIFLLAALVMAFVEESIFRGFVMLRLSAWLGQTWGWLLSAVLYVIWCLPERIYLQHLAWPDLGIDLALLLAFGLLQGWIMRKSGQIVAPTLFNAFHRWIGVF